MKKKTKNKKQDENKINACAVTDKGLGDVALKELKELTGVKGVAGDRTIVFKPRSYNDLFKYCYYSQAARRILLLFRQFTFSDYKDLMKKSETAIKNIDLKEWFDKDTSFRVECERIGKHDFSSQQVEAELGEKIILKAKQALKKEPAVNLDNPEVIFYLFISQEKAFLGLDLAGRDLSKRHYRIFSSPGSINACLSYALTRIAGYTPGKKLIDPHCKSGVLCIEAALFASKKSIHYYSKEFAFKKLKPFKRMRWDSFFKKLDSEKGVKDIHLLGTDSLLRNIEASNKNAKLAGAGDLTRFSKMDVEWLDTKLDKASVDILASRIQCPSKHVSEKRLQKHYKELFYQAEFIMKDKGVIALLTEDAKLLKNSVSKTFKIISEQNFWAGKQKYEVVLIERM